MVMGLKERMAPLIFVSTSSRIFLLGFVENDSYLELELLKHFALGIFEIESHPFILGFSCYIFSNLSKGLDIF